MDSDGIRDCVWVRVWVGIIVIDQEARTETARVAPKCICDSANGGQAPCAAWFREASGDRPASKVYDLLPHSATQCYPATRQRKTPGSSWYSWDTTGSSPDLDTPAGAPVGTGDQFQLGLGRNSSQSAPDETDS